MIIKNKESIQWLEKNKEHGKYFKVIKNNDGDLCSINAPLRNSISGKHCLNTNKTKLNYKVDMWTTSNEEISNIGYFPLVFDKFINALIFVKDHPIIDYGIYYCEVCGFVTKPVCKPIDYSKDLSYRYINFDAPFDPLDPIGLLDPIEFNMFWPEGTIMARYIKLTDKVPFTKKLKKFIDFTKWS